MRDQRLENRIYCFFRSKGETMNTPKIEPPTKKAFNFPKSAPAKNKKALAKAPVASEVENAAPTPRAAKKTARKEVIKPSASASKPGQAEKSSQKLAKPAAEKSARTVASKSKDTASASEAKRAKKEKVVRDSFTMPKSDYAKLASLKQKCLANGVRVKKSELLRAALAMLDSAPEKRIVAAIKALETVKTGRPAAA
ncbi:hypothetical protein [Burkholderia sp. THE68]|uniref:hypothetical protein n=1 Tax=Burkholderia sp. THE68 TaxID=758782 RepID=UPI00336A0402